MKKVIFLLLSLFLINSAAAQKTEYSFHLNSSLFSFGGESATQSSIIIVSDVATIDNYTNNPYGKEKTFSYGLGAQVKRITKNQLILGMQAGYETLRSRVHINGVSGEFMASPEVPNGRTVLSQGFINLYPYLGIRFIFDEVETDLAVGPEFGFNTFSREKGKANLGNDSSVETDTERNNSGTDFRLRPSLTVNYKNWGVSAGYSYGLHNYSVNLTGTDQNQYSRLVRFGIHYTIN